jgi:membrane associated rhomboid family serine protease
LAYGILFGDRIVYFMFVFPMQARWFVVLLGAAELIMLINQGIGGGKVANLAHLGGIVAGYLTLVFTTWLKKRRKPPGSGSGRKLKLVVDNAKPKYWN